MSAIEDTLDEVRDTASHLLNADDRSAGHVLLGIAVTAGFALIATAVATGTVSPTRRRRAAGDGSTEINDKPKGAFGYIVPALFSATTFSAVRVWNAPANKGRTAALALWAIAQSVNSIWIAARPRSRPVQMVAAMTSAGLAAAFAYEARKLDRKAGGLASPIGGSVRLGNLLDREVEDSQSRLR